MNYIRIIIQDQVSISVFETDPKYRLLQQDCANSIIDFSDTLIFYDWLIDDTKRVQGIEIHIDEADWYSWLKKRVQSIPGIDVGPFIRIWFFNQMEGHEQGLEAFGDIYFIRSDHGCLSIIVGVESWLEPLQAKQLITDINTIVKSG